MNLPAMWESDYKEKLEEEIFKCLDANFHDKHFNKKDMMFSVMQKSRGCLNPHQVSNIIDEYINLKK